MAALLVLCFQLHAQNKSNKGKEFWLGYGYNYYFNNEPPINNQTLAIYICAEEAATVTVSVNSTGWSQTVNIPANTVDFSINIPKSGLDDARILAEGLSTKGIHIVGNVPVVVYAHQYYVQLSGATMLMPVETYGYTYYSVNYAQTSSNVQDWYSWFFVVASEDNTRLQITPSDTTQGGWIKGQTYTVNLNKGEIYNVFGKAVFDGTSSGASKDMTGSKIVSVTGSDGACHPVAVFSGSSGIRLCNGDGGEFMHQQVFPANAWGTRYLTYHTLNNFTTNVTAPNLNYYRIAVQDPSTVVKRNGVVLTGITNNFYYEFSSVSGDYIESDKPILLAQYMMNANQCTGTSVSGYGDPEMFYLSPIEQGVKEALFYNSRHYGIDFNYVNILLPGNGINSLRVDGNPLPAANIITHPINSSYSVAVARLTGAGAQHTITCDSAFTATLYGLGIFESYGYNVGCLVNNLNSYGSIKNTFNSSGNIDTFTCPKTQVKLFIKTAYLLTNIHWKLSLAGGGISPNADSIIVNPIPIASGQINGRTYYTYTLQQDFTFTTAGTYFIPVTYRSPGIDNCDNTETTNIKVVVKAGPAADFSTSTANCLSDSIHFTGIPTTGGFNIINYKWDFDDLTTSNTVNTVKKFYLPGNQHVRYRIFADNGCTGDTTKLVVIADSPVVKFGFSAGLCLGDSVRFTDTSSIASGSISNWNWDFGDSHTAVYNNGNPFYHKYAAAGNYTVALVVISANGCKSDTLRRSLTVLPKPVARFGFDHNICIGDSVKFSDSSYIGQSITSWYWNFADGNSITQSGPAAFYHTYLTANNFIVSLQVTDNNGCKSDSFRLPVIVTAKPVVSFTNTGKPCIDSVQSFTSSVPFNSASTTSWYWDFGDGHIQSSSTSNTATHVYTAALANITVKHAVATGCASDTVPVLIPLISSNPVAAFDVVTDTVCVGKPVSFSSPISTAGLTWNWDFGNGTGSNLPPFSRLYSNAGNHTVKLIVKTDDGCGSSPVIKIFNVAALPNIDAGPDIVKQATVSKMIQASISNPSGYDLLWSPPFSLNAVNILKPVTSTDHTIVYTVMAIDKTSHCIAYDDVTVNVVTEIFVPNAFAPGSGGSNDLWRIPALQFYPLASVQVYNSYGQKVYEAKGKASWDGTFKGKPQPTGTYIYYIKPTDNPLQNIKGTLTIIR